MPSQELHQSRSLAALLLCLLFGGPSTAIAQTSAAPIAEVAALRAEVQKLSRELLQYRAELIEWKMQALGAELRHVEAERHRLGAERQLIEREIGELNIASTNNPGGEDEARREELNKVQMPALLAGESAAAARATTLAAALNAENTRLAAIRQELQRIGSSPAHKSP